MGQDPSPVPDHTDKENKDRQSQDRVGGQDQKADIRRRLGKGLDTEIVRSGVSSEHKSHLADRLVDRIRELEGICHIRSAGSCR